MNKDPHITVRRAIHGWAFCNAEMLRGRIKRGLEERAKLPKEHRQSAVDVLKPLYEKLRGFGACSYPNCSCIVSTSTSQPEPVCPKGLEVTP